MHHLFGRHVQVGVAIKAQAPQHNALLGHDDPCTSIGRNPEVFDDCRWSTVAH